MIFITANSKNLKFSLTEDYPKLTKEEMVRVEESWEEKKRQNPDIFNGESFSCNGLELDKSGNILFHLNKIEYKIHVFNQFTKSFKSGYQGAVVGSYVYDENYFYLAVRSNKVTFRAGLINSILGGVDYQKEAVTTGFFNHLKTIAKQEVDEELICEFPTDTKDLTLLGISYDEETFRLDVRFLLKNTAIKVGNEESSALVKVKRDEISKFYKENKQMIVQFDWLFIERIIYLQESGLLT